MTSPSRDTKDAEHPPRLTTDESTLDVGLARSFGSSSSPSFFSVSACLGAAICDGIHMPPGFSKATFGAFGGAALAVGAGGAFGVAGGGGGGGSASGPHADTRPRARGNTSTSERRRISTSNSMKLLGF
jgi:hypothetical protein